MYCRWCGWAYSTITPRLPVADVRGDDFAPPLGRQGADHFPNLAEVVFEGLPAPGRFAPGHGAAGALGGRSRCGDAERHVGVLRVGEDEVAGAVGVSSDARELEVEALKDGHGSQEAFPRRLAALLIRNLILEGEIM